MIKLTINNSMSKLEGLNAVQLKQLRNVFSYNIDAQAAYFSGSPYTKRYLLDKRGFFPTGLLYLFYAWVKKTKVNFTNIDQRVKPCKIVKTLTKFNLPHIPYPEQVEAAEAIVKRHRGIICAPTGVGKSVIAALVIHKLKVRTLVVVPSLELKRQLTYTLSQAFPEASVGHLRASPDIAVENIDALDYTQKLSSYDCVIIDEFHHSAAKTYRMLNQKAWGNIYYRVGMTATPFRTKSEERLLLESLLSQLVYKISYNTAVSKGYIVPMEAYYYDLPKLVVEGYTWAEVYKELVVNNESRNRLLHEILLKLHASCYSTLCLVKEIRHGEILSNGVLPFANGLDEGTKEMIESFNQAATPVLIGTEGVLGEGVDTKPAEFIIIAGLGKSRSAFMQKCGRGFRKYGDKESCKIIIFRDPSHKWTLAHFREQCKILKEEYGVIPLKLQVLT